MEKQVFTIACPGGSCPLQNKPASHSHMPPQAVEPCMLQIDPEVTQLAERIITSYNGLAGDEDTAWAELEMQEFEQVIARNGLGFLALQ